jgi:11-cis-retinol dehydrogenase
MGKGRVAAVALLVLGAWYYYYMQVQRHKAKIRLESRGRKRYVVITGCDSGFGKELSLRLCRAGGFDVISGCLFESGVEVLERESQGAIVAKVLDVSKSESVTDFIRFVREKVGADGVFACVNNAGIAPGLFLDWTPHSMAKKTIDINLIGLMDVSKQIVPLLRKYGGEEGSRLVNVASCAGIIAPPSMSAYCASKFGVVGFSRCIRNELNDFNIHVSIIEPGFFKTAMVASLDKSMNDLWAGLDEETRELYGEEFHKGAVQMTKDIHKGSQDPMIVVDAMYDAITSVVPKDVYLVGNDAHAVVWWVAELPWFVQNFLFDVFLKPVKPKGAYKYNRK